MILESKGVAFGVWVTGIVGGVVGAQIGADLGTSLVAAVLAVVGFVIALLLALAGWALRQIHRELRELVLDVRGLNVTVHGVQGHGGLVRRMEDLDAEKISEHKANNMIHRALGRIHEDDERADEETRRREL